MRRTFHATCSVILTVPVNNMDNIPTMGTEFSLFIVCHILFVIWQPLHAGHTLWERCVFVCVCVFVCGFVCVCVCVCGHYICMAGP